MKILLAFVSSVVLCVSLNSNGQPWELAMVKEGINVYTRIVEKTDFKEFKGETVISAAAEELAAKIMDVENYPKWCYKTRSIKLLKKEADKVFYYYISETPPIVKNREGYYCNQISTDEKTKTITIKMNTFESKEPVPENFTRIPLSNGIWTLTPLSGNRTKVVFEMQAEPGGIIPSWMANLVVVDSPWVTLDHLRKLVAKKDSTK